METKRCPRCTAFAMLCNSLIIAAAACLSSCKKIECGRYEKYVLEEQHRNMLLDWADDNVLNRTFTDDELRKGALVGPGARFKAVSIERAGIKIPSWLEGYEIRILGPDQYTPNVIFVGQRRYQGLIIGRSQLPGSLRGTEVDPKFLDHVIGRVALMCYQEHENMAEKKPVR